jgi:hypothetical protein
VTGTAMFTCWIYGEQADTTQQNTDQTLRSRR